MRPWNLQYQKEAEGLKNKNEWHVMSTVYIFESLKRDVLFFELCEMKGSLSL